jgi:hypothetical protein
MPQETPGHEGRSAPLHPENEDRPVERHPVDGGEVPPQGTAPAITPAPTLGLNRDGPEKGSALSRVAAVE